MEDPTPHGFPDAQPGLDEPEPAAAPEKPVEEKKEQPLKQKSTTIPAVEGTPTNSETEKLQTEEDLHAKEALANNDDDNLSDIDYGAPELHNYMDM